MSWKKGPLPAGTYKWGGVVPFDVGGDGFYFSDFQGNHVTLDTGRVLKSHEILWYNNSIDMPPESKLGRLSHPKP